MTVTMIALIVLLLVAIVLIRLVRVQRTPILQVEELAEYTCAVDMEAFQNLIDPEESRFLRRSLSPAQFRIVQRERNLGAVEYVRRIAHNAGALIQLGQVARLSPDPAIAEAARVMVDRAAHVRILATLVLVKLYSSTLIPAVQFAPEDIFRDYRALTEAAVSLTRLQRPAFAGRVGAML